MNYNVSFCGGIKLGRAVLSGPFWKQLRASGALRTARPYQRPM